MEDHRVGMTLSQKILTFVPLALVCGYVGLAATGVLSLFQTQTAKASAAAGPYVFLLPSGKCDVSRPILEVDKGDDVKFKSLDGKPYKIVFDSSNDPFDDQLHQYPSDKPFSIKQNATVAYYGYKISYNSQDCSPIETIGIIVTH